MPLIDHTYFIGELNIPNTNDPDIQLNLNRFIKKYEEKFLRELFGYQLYTGFTAAILIDPITDIWVSLKDLLVNTENKTSPIANYVYYWWMRDQVTQTLGIGEVASKSDNSVIVSPGPKMSRAWNEMVDQIWRIVSFLDTNVIDYPGWSWYHNGYTGSNYWRTYNYARLNDVFYPINTMNF